MQLIFGVIYGIAFVLGICIFSFVNVLIWRVPRKMKFGNDRSICTTCGHVLAPLDLVPVFSYLFLGGKCRYCGDKISFRYPAVELLGGVLSVLCVWKYVTVENLGYQSIGQAGVVFLLFILLTAISFVDAETMEIPNGFVVAVLVISLISIPFFPDISLVERLIGIVCISVPMTLLAMAIPGAFGGGDIKLMAAVGIFLGWKLSLMAFLIGVFLGGMYGIYLLASKKKDRKAHFAFGPFLCVGIGVALFWGIQLMNWYLGLLR